MRAEDLSTAELFLLVLYSLGILAGEVISAILNPYLGVCLHALLLTLFIVHAATAVPRKVYRLYLALVLAPLIRILDLSLPLVHVPRLYQFFAVGFPVFMAAVIVCRMAQFKWMDIGLTRRHLLLQIPIAAAGVPLGVAEYFLLKPRPLVEDLNFGQIWLPVLVLLTATGFLEEMVFRGVMYRAARQCLGYRAGQVFVAFIFASMNVIHLMLPDVLFVFAVALFFGWVVERTGSIVGVSVTHGVINILVYLICPNVLK